MKQNENRKPIRRGPVFLVSVLLLALALTAGGTIAWLVTGSGRLDNTFQPGEVTAKIVETIDGIEKKNVTVKNTGAVDAYIRVAIVATWEDGKGNLLAEPVKEDDVTYTGLPGKGWIQIGDYYYYTKPVAAGASTGNLADSITVDDATADRVLNLQILAEAIQADGRDKNGTPAVETAWPVQIDGDGNLSKTSS